MLDKTTALASAGAIGTAGEMGVGRGTATPVVPKGVPRSAAIHIQGGWIDRSAAAATYHQLVIGVVAFSGSMRRSGRW